ncbi:MAG: manganese efflux pump [Eubacteriales bacterium]
MNWKRATVIGLFSVVQALMPLVGWLLGKQFEHLITSVDHWIRIRSALDHRRQDDL